MRSLLIIIKTAFLVGNQAIDRFGRIDCSIEQDFFRGLSGGVKLPPPAPPTRKLRLRLVPPVELLISCVIVSYRILLKNPAPDGAASMKSLVPRNSVT
jgi:hypothetical protein